MRQRCVRGAIVWLLLLWGHVSDALWAHLVPVGCAKGSVSGAVGRRMVELPSVWGQAVQQIQEWSGPSRIHLFDSDGAQITSVEQATSDAVVVVRCVGEAAGRSDNSGEHGKGCESEHNRGVNQLMGGNYSMAESLLRAAVKECPSVPEWWNNLGEALRMSEDVAGAEEAYRRSIALRPDNAAAPTRNLGRVLVASRRLDEAIPVLYQVAAHDRLAGNSADEAAVRVALGLALIQQQQQQQALEQFLLSQALQPR